MHVRRRVLASLAACLALAGAALVQAVLVAAANHDVVASTAQAKFTPTSLTIDVGDNVTVTKGAGGLSHNIHWEDQANPCPGPPTTSAWTCERTFNGAGTFVAHCDLHTSMTLTVTVQAAATPTPTPKPPTPPPPTPPPAPTPPPPTPHPTPVPTKTLTPTPSPTRTPRPSTSGTEPPAGTASPAPPPSTGPVETAIVRSAPPEGSTAASLAPMTSATIDASLAPAETPLVDPAGSTGDGGIPPILIVAVIATSVAGVVGAYLRRRPGSPTGGRGTIG